MSQPPERACELCGDALASAGDWVGFDAHGEVLWICQACCDQWGAFLASALAITRRYGERPSYSVPPHRIG